jgi:hypothetical protein
VKLKEKEERGPPETIYIEHVDMLNYSGVAVTWF